MTPSSLALTLFLSLGGAPWFDALPPGPRRYEAIDRMVDMLIWRTGCSEGEARKAVSGAISGGEEGKGKMRTINELNRLYPYPKPSLTLQIFILGLIVVSGLIALFFAAFHAFSLVAGTWQAFFAALVIEAGLIAECLAIINKPRSVPPWLGLVISYIVSGTYNYTQAAGAGQNLGGWELGALAFGPLSALAVVSLAFGNELRSYQERTETWNKNRADWVEGERRRLEIAAREREQARLELEVKQNQAKLEAEQKHAEKMARIEAKKDAKLPRNNQAKKRISKANKREISLNILKEFPTISGAELGRQLGATERTGQNILNELEQAGVIHRNGEGWKVE